MLNAPLNQDPQPTHPGITKEQLMAHANDQARLLQQAKNNNHKTDSTGLFLIRTGTHWMTVAGNEPQASMLFGEFWHEGELCILFADTNLGKSILAVQIGDSISLGQPIQPLKLQADAQKIIYFDFELTKKQFQNRYQNEMNEEHPWDTNFLRAEINPDNMPDDQYSFEEFLNLSMQKAIEDYDARILIIDNLTYLRTETEKAKDALPLMKSLKQLKNKYNLSILALAHTPKRNAADRLTCNDLQGSKMLINFCDSAFAIGQSQQDKNLRYIKQIKQRNTEEIYGRDNICLFKIAKPDRFLKFEFEGYGNEDDHITEQPKYDSDELHNQVIELQQQGKSVRETALLLQVSKSKVSRLLNRTR